MSPFSQLPTIGGNYGNGIDRDFSPILHYIDEFDRHFSRRHRFVNCFIPRFDLEEDDHSYYLYGDIPGANVDDITIEAHDKHTLVISGKTEKPSLERRNQDMETPGGGPADTLVKAQIEDHEHSHEILMSNPDPRDISPAPSGDAAGNNMTGPSYPPPPQSTQNSTYPHHQRHPTFKPALESWHLQPDHRILLSERLVGDFHRNFAFPQPIVEEGVKAGMENGVLSLIVPKREKGEDAKRVRKVPIIHGTWWKGKE